MYTKSAQWYDLLHANKNYAAESAKITSTIQRFTVEATDLLDVACGTGGHLRYLREQFDCHGIDIDAGLLDIAREQLPDVGFTEADMTEFDLGRQFDAVTCLFSAIGYVRTNENLALALRRMAAHLRVGGVLVVEPWILPDKWDAWLAEVGNYHVEQHGELTVGRFQATQRTGTMTELLFHYLATDGKQLVCADERHAVRMFTVDELLDAAEMAGLAAEWDPIGIGRGLLIGVRLSG